METNFKCASCDTDLVKYFDKVLNPELPDSLGFCSIGCEKQYSGSDEEGAVNNAFTDDA